MEFIKNYKLKEFYKQSTELQEEYINLLRFSLPIPTAKVLWDLSLKDVDFIKSSFGSGDDSDMFEIISRVQGVPVEDVLNIKIVEFFGLIADVKKQIEEIHKVELTALTPSGANFKWEAVNGSEKMSQFGIYNTLEQLSGGDITKYAEIMEMEYSEVFTVLYMKKTRLELDEEMSKITSKR